MTGRALQTLEWLKVVGAVRRIEGQPDGGFVVETQDRKLLELDAASVPAFRAGVLAGWRLPRDGSWPPRALDARGES